MSVYLHKERETKEEHQEIDEGLVRETWVEWEREGKGREDSVSARLPVYER
jgi:hypothetical protein